MQASIEAEHEDRMQRSASNAFLRDRIRDVTEVMLSLSGGLAGTGPLHLVHALRAVQCSSRRALKHSDG